MARVKWLIVLLCLSVSACQPGAATVSPTAQGTVPAVLPTAVVPDATSGATTPSGPATQNGIMPTDPNQIKAQVETIVNQYLAAMSHQDAQALAKVIDLERLSFKRGQNDLLQQPLANRWIGKNATGTVTTVQIAKEPYVKAWVTDNSGRNFIWTFKWTGQGWILSEPAEDELGELKNKEYEQFTLRFYAWDEALVDEVAKNIQIAYQTAVASTGRTPKQKFLVRMAATFETQAGGMNVNTRASYNTQNNMIAISSPESFHGSFFGTDVSQLSRDLVHEMTHLLVNDALYPRGTIWWVNEAFAHYFSNDIRADYVRRAVAQNVTLKDLNKLEVAGGIDDSVFLYRYAGAAAVQYMVEKLGGKEKAWEWLIEEAQDRDFNTSLQKVYGLSYDQFEKGWQDFMKQMYG